MRSIIAWFRGPWVAPDPAPALSWLDRADGLTFPGTIRASVQYPAPDWLDDADWQDTRREPCPWSPPETWRARANLHATLRAVRTRYDAVLDSGPDEPGGDLPLTNIQVLGRDRYAQCDETCTADCGACKGRRFGPYAIPLPTRYDAEWPSVRAAEAPGGDLAAMAAPLPGMARDALGTYAEPVTVLIEADVSRFRDEMAHAARKVAELTAPVKPRGRHRQTDPAELILADLRDLDGL